MNKSKTHITFTSCRHMLKLKLKLIVYTWLDKKKIKNSTWLTHVDACEMKKFQSYLC